MLRSYTGPFGTTVQQIITPSVAAYVQQQFGCSALMGADLEDEGGDGTQYSHWEYRLFQARACRAAWSILLC